MCSTEYKCVSQTVPVMKFQSFEVHWLVGPEKDMILFSINMINNIKIPRGNALIYVFCEITRERIMLSSVNQSREMREGSICFIL